MRVLGRLVVWLALLLAAALLLVRLAPRDWPAAPGDVPGWLAAGPVEARVVALAAVAAWGCLAWLAFVLVAVACGAFPRGAVRDAAERVLGVAVVGVATGALVAGPAAADGPFDRPAGPAPPSRTGPGTTAGVGGAPGAAGSSTPAPGVLPSWEAVPPWRAPAPAASSAPTTRPGAPESPAWPGPAGWPELAGPTGSTAREPPGSPTASANQVVVVARGDTLWDIAARRLGAGASPALTAASWPRWYAANRSVVGPDPDRILPGQRLVPPPDGGAR